MLIDSALRNSASGAQGPHLFAFLQQRKAHDIDNDQRPYTCSIKGKESVLDDRLSFVLEDRVRVLDLVILPRLPKRLDTTQCR